MSAFLCKFKIIKRVSILQLISGAISIEFEDKLFHYIFLS
jgi:hypothetical protein